ncbi:MAG: TRAM domain-containing protein, partial [Clostridia bacterium]|nr:TRAM domain-containing protein [Clostridia bacterium]
MTAECAGVGRHEGFAVFVPGALPGERVNAHIMKVASNYAVGKLTGVIEASKDRVDPACPAASKCGGCALQHMSYPAQLDFKRGLVRDALIRI